MATAFVRGNFFDLGSNGTSISTTFSSNNAGNLLVVAAELQNNSKSSISDSAGNIWQTGAIQQNGSVVAFRIFYCENCKASAGTNTITVTTNTLQHLRIAVAEYSGVATSLSYSTGAYSPNSLSTGSFATTAGDLVVAIGFALGGAIGAGTGMTMRETDGSFMGLADGTASGTSFSVAMTGGGPNQVAVAAFHAAPAASAGLYAGGDFSSSTGSGSYTESATFVSNTAGHALLAFVEVSATGTLSASISDTAGNTWSLIASVNNGSTWVQGLYACSSCVASTGKNVVTATFSLSGSSFIRFWIAEYAVPLVSPTNATGTSATTTLSASVASATGNLVVACGLAGTQSTMVPGGTYSGRKTDGSMLIQDGTASGSTETPSMTVGSGGGTIIALSTAGPVTAPTQRGNIDYDQIRTTARQGSGTKFQMAGTGTPTSGHMAVYDANGNVVDGGAPSTGAAFVREVPAGTLNGTNTAFTLSFTPSPAASLFLFVNGVEQVPTTDYTISGTTITYVTAPDSVDLMIAQYTH